MRWAPALFIASCLSGALHAQDTRADGGPSAPTVGDEHGVRLSLTLAARGFAPGQPVMAEVAVTNTGDHALTMVWSDQNRTWYPRAVLEPGGVARPYTPAGERAFHTGWLRTGRTIAPGATVAEQLDLGCYLDLHEEADYSATIGIWCGTDGAPMTEVRGNPVTVHVSSAAQ